MALDQSASLEILVISDAHTGLKAAIGWVLLGAAWASAGPAQLPRGVLAVHGNVQYAVLASVSLTDHSDASASPESLKLCNLA